MLDEGECVVVVEVVNEMLVEVGEGGRSRGGGVG